MDMVSPCMGTAPGGGVRGVRGGGGEGEVWASTLTENQPGMRAA